MQLDNKKKLAIIIILIIGIIIAFVIYMISDNTFQEISLEEISAGNIETIEENKESSKNNINKTNAETSNTTEELETKEKIIVHIVGEVKKEGIVYLNKGDRIIDAIEKAGGETKEADLSQINLAYELQDGQKIYIPNKNEKITEYITTASGYNQDSNDSNNNIEEGTKVNINTANLSELDSLPGIGPAIAQRIIEYREQNGNFEKIEDLQNVKGIGDAKYEEIKDSVTV